MFEPHSGEDYSRDEGRNLWGCSMSFALFSRSSQISSELTVGLTFIFLSELFIHIVFRT